MSKSFWSGKKVLVTGGAGFVGSHVTEQLCALGAKVRVADDLSTGSLEHLTSVRDDIELLEVDLRTPDAAARAVQGQEVVLNLAGFIAGIGYNKDRQTDFFVNNMLLQQWPLLAARDAGVSLFAQISSACVYPYDVPVPTPEHAVEQGPPEESNQGYGWGKRMGETLAQYVARESEMPVVLLRFFNVYGPRDTFDPERSHVIPSLINKCLSEAKTVDAWGSGNQTRSFVYVDDIAKLILQVTERQPAAEPINIGTPTEITIRDLIHLIADITQTKAEIRFDTSKPEGYLRRAPDLTRLYQVLGREPDAIPLRIGLERTVAFRQSQLQK